MRNILRSGDEKFINWLREFRDSEQQVLWTHCFTNFHRFSVLIFGGFQYQCNFDKHPKDADATQHMNISV